MFPTAVALAETGISAEPGLGEEEKKAKEAVEGGGGVIAGCPMK